MIWKPSRGAACAALFAWFVTLACSDTPGAPGAPAHVAMVSVVGDLQQAPGGATLPLPLTVRVSDLASGAALRDATVRFSLARWPAGFAHLSDSIVHTGPDGLARTELTLGLGAVDSVVVIARTARAAPVRFTTRVSAAPVVSSVRPATFFSGDTVTLVGRGLAFASAGGEVRFNESAVTPLSVSDTAVRAVAPPCVASGSVRLQVAQGGARTVPVTAEYRERSVPLSLATFDARVLPAATLGSCVTLQGGGAHYLVIAQLETDESVANGVDVTVQAGPAALAGVRVSPAFSTPGASGEDRTAFPRAFERVLRSRERQTAFLPRTAAVRAAAALPALGALRSFSVIASVDASQFADVTAKLRYVGDHILVWVDTTSIPDLPDSELQALSHVFDADLYPLDEATFGLPSDVDGNGHVHVVLTPVVNRLTPAGQCTLSGFVSGFFSAHDLYPAAAHANGGEVFYGFVPDSVATYGCSHPKSEFSRAIRNTFIHELQHLINYEQHVLLRGGLEEDIWLNEGLSHMAEETASRMYEARYPPPLGRGTPDQMFPDSSQGHILYNMINAYLFLRQPFVNSLTHFTEGGTIEERGAAWLFLRWLADHYGEDILRRLVQTSLHGTANVADKSGQPFSRLFGDFAIATYADSFPGQPRDIVPLKWHFVSRNLRAMFQRLNTVASFPPFPIDPLEVPYGGSVHGLLVEGGFVMLSVTTPADAPSTVLRFAPTAGGSWSASQHPQVSILRLP